MKDGILRILSIGTAGSYATAVYMKSGTLFIKGKDKIVEVYPKGKKK